MSYGSLKSALEKMQFSGMVVEGNRIGRTLGFPTANLHIDDPKVREAVPSGVFACRVLLADGSVYGGMMNVGTKPTLNGDDRRTMEIHLFNFQGDLYGQTLQVGIVKKIRDEQKFDNLDALKTQLEKDRLAVIKILSA